MKHVFYFVNNPGTISCSNYVIRNNCFVLTDSDGSVLIPMSSVLYVKSGVNDLSKV